LPAINIGRVNSYKIIQQFCK